MFHRSLTGNGLLTSLLHCCHPLILPSPRLSPEFPLISAVVLLPGPPLLLRLHHQGAPLLVDVSVRRFQ